MPLPADLQRFIDDELSRMPMLAERVRHQTAGALRAAAGRAASPAERTQCQALAMALEQGSRRFVDTFVEALVVQLRRDAALPEAAQAGPRGLALIDEAAQGADIEIARCAALIASEAEWELREMQTFTSALAGQPYVSVHSNPLRPEAFAIALWQAVDAVPQARGQAALLRGAAAALAEALRLELAAACTRLEAQGVQPSLYRTAVPSQGERESGLAALLHRPATTASTARQAADAATVALVDQLFDAIAQAAPMHAALRTLTGLVQGLAADLATRDSGLLDDTHHPLWLLLDRFGYRSVTHPEPADPQLLPWVGLATECVAALQATPMHDEAAWAAAVAQLDRYDAAQLNTQIQQAGADISALSSADTGHAGLGVDSMDTVPAHLVAGAVPADADRAAAEWLDAQTVGGWYRVFLRGRWRALRLLWLSESRGCWLFAGTYPQHSDAFRRDALVRLRAEKLIRPLVERSLILRAAESLRRRLRDRRSTH